MLNLWHYINNTILKADEYNAQVEEEVNELMKKIFSEAGDTVTANNNDNEEQEEVLVPEEAQETLNTLNKTLRNNNKGANGNKQPKNNARAKKQYSRTCNYTTYCFT